MLTVPLLSTAKVILQNGSVINTTATPVPRNQQHTGAFVLWKGFGKKKIRKSQRVRPQGWHGNHPAQKPLKVSRETLDDIPIWTPPSGRELKRRDEEPEQMIDADTYERDAAVASLMTVDFEEIFGAA